MPLWREATGIDADGRGRHPALAALERGDDLLQRLIVLVEVLVRIEPASALHNCNHASSWVLRLAPGEVNAAETPDITDRIVRRVEHDQGFIASNSDLHDHSPPALRVKILADGQPHDALHGVADLLRFDVVLVNDLLGDSLADPQRCHPDTHETRG